MPPAVAQVWAIYRGCSFLIVRGVYNSPVCWPLRFCEYLSLDSGYFAFLGQISAKQFLEGCHLYGWAIGNTATGWLSAVHIFYWADSFLLLGCLDSDPENKPT